MSGQRTMRFCLLACAMFICACGGGKGGDPPSTPTPAPSSNWDAATWDQSNWA